jgi:hypothetical protein
MLEQNNVKYIYVIELEHHYYFIHTSKETYPRKIFLDCEIYYDFIKNHKPIRIIKQFPFENDFLIDATVKEYMFMYGINFVRGGSYIDECLNPLQLGSIRKEFDIIESGLIYENELKNILSYEYREYESLDAVSKTYDEIEKQYENYLFEKVRYDNMFPKSFINKNTVLDIKPEDIDWLCEECKSQYENTTEYIHKYRKIVESLNHLYFLSKTTNFFEDKQDLIQEYEIHLKYPNFLFDSFIYNHSSNNNISLEYVNKICRIIKWMIDLVQNRIDEYKFDLSTYDTMIEWKTPRILYILEKKLCNR